MWLEDKIKGRRERQGTNVKMLDHSFEWLQLHVPKIDHRGFKVRSRRASNLERSITLL